MSSRFYCLCVIVLTWCFSQIALPCADAQQPTQSLDLPRKPLLHLDAMHLARVVGQSDVGEQSVTIWPDAQSPLLRFVAQGPEHAPKLIVGENWATVRFDGIDDVLRLYTPSASLGSASLWMVLALTVTPGTFVGFLRPMLLLSAIMSPG